MTFRSDVQTTADPSPRPDVPSIGAMAESVDEARAERLRRIEQMLDNLVIPACPLAAQILVDRILAECPEVTLQQVGEGHWMGWVNP